MRPDRKRQHVPLRHLHPQVQRRGGWSRTLTRWMLSGRRARLTFLSQAGEGWEALPDRFDDGGCSGGSLDRPALQRL